MYFQIANPKCFIAGGESHRIQLAEPFRQDFYPVTVSISGIQEKSQLRVGGMEFQFPKSNRGL